MPLGAKPRGVNGVKNTIKIEFILEINQLLKPENLRSIKGLELLARMTAQGLSQGINRSSRTGPGQEFSQYRSYQPGDDLRLVDWKLFARSDRFFVREAELETNTTIQFFLDASNSMLHEDNGFQKIDFARYLIATLAWLVQNQGDEIGLYALNDQQFYFLTPRPGKRYFQRFLFELVKVDGQGVFPSANQQTSDRILYQARTKPGTREIIVFVTDLYEKEEEINLTIRTLSQMKKEVIVFHLMGHNELTFDYQGAVSFEDLESGQQLQANPQDIKANYLTQLQIRLDQIKLKMLNWQVDYYLFDMSQPLGPSLQYFLKKRHSH